MKLQAHVNLHKSDPNTFHTVGFTDFTFGKNSTEVLGSELEEKTLDRGIPTFWVRSKYLEWLNPAVANISQPTSLRASMRRWVSLLSQLYRKCLDFSDLLPALLTVRGCTVTPLTQLLQAINLRRIPNADSTKTPHNERSYSDLDWQERTAPLSFSDSGGK